MDGSDVYDIIFCTFVGDSSPSSSYLSFPSFLLIFCRNMTFVVLQKTKEEEGKGEEEEEEEEKE